jgi:hypothetical protein
VKVGRLAATFALLLCVGVFSVNAATIYTHTSQILSGHLILPVIPEPGSLVLVGSAFLGLAAISRRFKKSAADNTPS